MRTILVDRFDGYLLIYLARFHNRIGRFKIPLDIWAKFTWKVSPNDGPAFIFLSVAYKSLGRLSRMEVLSIITIFIVLA